MEWTILNEDNEVVKYFTGSEEDLILNVDADQAYISGRIEIVPPTEDEAVILERKRNSAFIDRYTFCQRCFEKGILSESDAIELGKGNIPPSTRAILDAMPHDESFNAELKWAAMSTVNRNDSLVINSMAAIGIPEIMLDHIFDIFPYSAD